MDSSTFCREWSWVDAEARVARWRAVASRCEEEDGLDWASHTNQVDIIIFFFSTSSSSFSGKGLGKEGVRRTQLTLLTSFKIFFLLASFHVQVSSFLKGLWFEDKGFPLG